MRKIVPGLTIYYIGPIVLDSRAFPAGMVINTGLEFRFSSRQPGIIAAHELHHLLIKHSRKTVHRKYQSLINTIESVQKEGIADLIDKKFVLFQNDTFYAPLFEKDLLASDSIIHNFNLQLEKMSISWTDFNFRKLISRGGHTPGHYMALVIEKNGFISELLENLHRPVAFFLIYNQAAAKDPSKPTLFSEESVSFLKDIEKQCFK